VGKVSGGPIYSSFDKGDGRITVSFDNLGQGLATAGDGPLKGFAVAGNDRKFVWAEARIEGDKVVVSSAQVRHPAAVRYAWAANPACNLTNSEGIPASPFRTDNWEEPITGR
jgi:sialate O-acetylesterase